ncbi:MAG: type II secretion system GspH family protein [Candidatus Omnitrophica bacterium]|nr:type II secretion system GspH family protein [Candidatus Omnitrophota bacterium]
MKRGVTLVEVLVVILIFSILFGIIFTFLLQSDRSFSLGRNKLEEQQEARKILSGMGRLLRKSSPDWVINSTHYPLSISENSTRIDFYVPFFNNTSNEIENLKKITFKLNPENQTQLLKKEGTEPAVVVAQDIESIYFDNLENQVMVNITIRKETGFIFNNYTVTLRNINTILEDTEVIEPEGGEF